jgi:arsenite methyltransferase
MVSALVGRSAVVPQVDFNEAVAQQLEVLYGTRDVRRRRALVIDALAPSTRERIIDVGCGPGFYVADLLEVVGPEGSVVGVDMSPDMIALAKRRTAERANVALHEGDLSRLPASDGEFDAALCVQVMEYVDDPVTALAEIHRVLRPGGRLVVWDVDWSTLSWHSSDEQRMRRVLSIWDQHLAHPALPRTLGAALRSAGYENVTMTAHVFATDRLDPETYGGSALTVMAGFVAGRSGLEPGELDAWRADQDELHRRGEFYFSCVQVCFQAGKPG